MGAEQATHPLLQFPIIPYVLIFLIFYFLVIKPQKDKQNQHKQMLANLKKNDRIITAGGMHGTIVNVKEKTIILRIDDNVKIEIDKEAIATVLKDNN
ncbi:MAG: preprotein translocase subunit YajC [Candidatus Omnitrophota bacterium]